MSDPTRPEVPSIMDGQLVRYLDGECSPEEREATLRLLEDSAEARDRLARLQDTTGSLSDALAGQALPPLPALDLPERVAVGRGAVLLGGRWRAAAAAVVLLGVGLSVQPVRAFIVDGFTRVWAVLAPQSPDSPETPEVPVEPALPSTVSFVPSGPTFVVDVTAPQAEGVLTVERTDLAQVTASVVDGAGEALVVLPGGLRIDNTTGSSAAYRVLVPAGLRTVEVRVAGATVVRISPSDDPGRWEVPLTRR